ncbi:hypothetical protein AOL_s00043g639 [Orbilia oligospora ATCC 24927]|uniref:Uncharacterized protein n=1 Tax=Arthrobotrys oligospora (strain ATCC 24927 / CBS 115.81 / DSM 1491) TaxID=756982 RepID=G1X4L5_ARTOA|nr:hypothetical protein AOL_s00043g639 [Orbilia oligospora ATCC 24927]EGX51905.1 hypothetical protein AOL_s00043g639 [Orbilia oligospora ATCC 24927]
MHAVHLIWRSANRLSGSCAVIPSAVSDTGKYGYVEMAARIFGRQAGQQRRFAAVSELNIMVWGYEWSSLTRLSAAVPCSGAYRPTPEAAVWGLTANGNPGFPKIAHPRQLHQI